jgi:phage-related protein
MATVTEIKAKLSAVVASVAAIAAAQPDIAASLSNIAADIQRLKDQIGTGTPGLTAEEAAEVDLELAVIVDQLTAAAETVTDNAAALKAASEVVPEPTEPPV